MISNNRTNIKIIQIKCIPADGLDGLEIPSDEDNEIIFKYNDIRVLNHLSIFDTTVACALGWVDPCMSYLFRYKNSLHYYR